MPPLVRNILAVASGAAAGQVVAFAFSPLITRIYGPEAFGLQGVFLSLLGILAPVAALRYPMAIVTAADDGEAGRIAQLSLWIAVCICGLILVLLAIGREPIFVFLGFGQLGYWIWCLPPALFAVVLYDVANYRAARAGRFRRVAAATVAGSFATNLARVLGGLAVPVAGVLVAITTLAPALQAALLGGTGSRKPALTRPEATALLAEHREFPVYRMPTDVVNAASQAVPVLLLTALVSPVAAGFYVLAGSAMNLPLNIMGTAVGQVYYARFADLHRAGKPLFSLVLRTTLAQALLPGAATLLAIPILPATFAFVFGETWRTSGEYAQWMALWVAVMLVNIPGVRALPVIGRQAVHLLFTSIILGGGVAGLIIGFRVAGNAEGAVVGFSVATAALYAAQIGTYLWLVLVNDRSRLCATA